MRVFLLSSLISLAWTQDDFGGGMPGGGGIGGLGGPGPGTIDVADGGMDMAKMASLEGPGGRPDMAQMMAGLNAEGLGGAEGPGGMDMASMMAGMGGMGGAGDALTGPEPFPAVKTDVKFIACSTCKLLAERLHSQMSKWDSKVTKSEEGMQAKVADMCVTSSDAGSWITEHDMVESKDGKAVELERQNEQGACEVECKTIAEACKAVVHEAEIELAAGLYKSFNGKKKKPLDLKALTSKLCTSDDAWAANVEGSCAAGVPKVPKKRKAGPAFRPKPPPPPPAPPPPPKKNAKAEAAPKTVAEVAAEGGKTVAEVAAKTVAAVAAASKKDAEVAAAPKKDSAPKKEAKAKAAPKKDAEVAAAPKKNAESNAEL